MHILNCFPSTAPSSAPQDLRNTSTDETSIIVQWGTVVCIDRNSEITGYVLRYGEASSDQREEAEIAGSGDEGGTSTITGLSPYTEYSIGVSAVNSDSQTGPFADITTQTLQDSRSINSVSFSVANITCFYTTVAFKVLTTQCCVYFLRARATCVSVSHPLPHLPPTHLVCSPPAQWGHYCI